MICRRVKLFSLGKFVWIHRKFTPKSWNPFYFCAANFFVNHIAKFKFWLCVARTSSFNKTQRATVGITCYIQESQLLIFLVLSPFKASKMYLKASSLYNTYFIKLDVFYSAFILSSTHIKEL